MKYPPGLEFEGVLETGSLDGYRWHCDIPVLDDSSRCLIRRGMLRPVADDFDEVLSPPFTEQTPEEDRSQEPCGRQAWINASIPPRIWVEPRPKSTRLPPRCLLQNSGFTTFAGGSMKRR